MADLSVIVVNWNAIQFLPECLRSVTRGAGQCSVEIIVVDNASTDGSPATVEKGFPNVTLIQTGNNLGFAKANNLAMRKSTGRYICLANPDVVVSEGCLDRMSAYMDHHPSIGMLGPKVLNSDSTLQLSCKRFPSLWNSICRALALDAIFPNWPLLGDPLMRAWAHDTVKRVDILSGCFWMLRREALEQVGLLDEDFFMYGEDMDYCKRYWQNSWEVVYWPEATILHYGGASSSHFPVRFEVENLKGTLRYWKKHHGRLAQLTFSCINLLHQVRRMLQGTIGYVFSPSRRKRFLNEVKAGAACSLQLFRVFSI